MGERGVEAAPATTMNGFKTEMDGRGDGIGGQQGIGQFEQSVGTTLKAGIECGTEVLEGGEGQ